MNECVWFCMFKFLSRFTAIDVGHQVLVPAFLAVYPLDANAAGAESGVTAAQGPICSLSVFLSVQDHSVGSTNNSSQVLRAIQGHLGSTLRAMLSVKLHFMLSWPRL